MILSEALSRQIIAVTQKYVGRFFDWDTFNCVHFVREVYREVGIELPRLVRGKLPPQDFHLSKERFESMPLGHSVFFRRRTSISDRSWTHVAIIAGRDQLVHCTRHLGNGVSISSTLEFLNVYELALDQRSF